MWLLRTAHSLPVKWDEQDAQSEGRAHRKSVRGLSKQHPEGDHSCDWGQEFSECQLLTLSDGILTLGLERKLQEGLASPDLLIPSVPAQTWRAALKEVV